MMTEYRQFHRGCRTEVVQQHSNVLARLEFLFRHYCFNDFFCNLIRGDKWRTSDARLAMNTEPQFHFPLIQHETRFAGGWYCPGRQRYTHGCDGSRSLPGNDRHFL